MPPPIMIPIAVTIIGLLFMLGVRIDINRAIKKHEVKYHERKLE